MTKPTTLIIGAGIVGATTAYTLARAGHPVQVIEQAEPGMGVTARSSGWINWITVDPEEDPERYASCQASFGRYHALNQAFNGMLVTRRYGALRWLREKAQTEAMIAKHEKAGSPVEAVEGVRLRSLAPLLNDPPPLAAYCADDFILDARAASARLLDDAKALGAQVQTNAYAISIDAHGGRATGVKVDDDTHQADRIIVAAGVATNELLEPLGAGMPVATSPAALIRFTASDMPHMPIIAAPGMEVHTHAPGILTMAKSVPEGLGDDPLVSADLAEKAERALRQAMPNLKNLQMVGSTIGARPVPTQGKPLVGSVDGIEGLLTAVAHPGVILAPEIAQNLLAQIDQV